MKYLGVAAIVSLFSLLSGLTSAQECAANGECDTHERCSAWKEEGECLRNAEYMKEFCPASCINVERSTNGECKDLHPRCSLWADLGECDDNAAEMNKFCTKACGVCPEDLAAGRVKEEENCEDKHSSCLYWSNKGECESNKRWMSTQCAKSCGTCEKLKPRYVALFVFVFKGYRYLVSTKLQSMIQVILCQFTCLLNHSSSLFLCLLGGEGWSSSKTRKRTIFSS